MSEVKIIGQIEGVSAQSAGALVESGQARVIGPGEIELYVPTERTAADILSAASLWSGSSLGREGSTLSFPLMREIYRKSSAVRPAVDFIINTLSTTPFRIQTVEGMRVAQKNVRRAEQIFTQPMNEIGSETFRDLLAQLLKDQLVLDHGIILKHFDKKNLMAFEAMDAATFFPVANEYNRLEKWVQKIEGLQDRNYKKDEIVFFRRSPRTDSPFGEPIIETIVSEVNALINASKMFSYSMDRNEIPPGILLLMGGAGMIGQKQRFKRRVGSDQGYTQQYKLRIMHGPADAKWIETQKPFHEMQVAELMEKIERIVFRNFGVDRIAMGSAQDINRSTAEAMVSTRHFSLFKPILDLWADKFTYEVLQSIDPGLYIEFIHFARTGSEEDLMMLEEGGPPGMTVRPTGRDCTGCEGKGWVTYEDNIGDGRRGSTCPLCHGRGTPGPLFISRPRFASQGPVNDLSGVLSNPEDAWRYLSTPLMKEVMGKRIQNAKAHTTSMLESISDRDSLLAAAADIRLLVNRLGIEVYEETRNIVKQAGRLPTDTPISEYKQRIDDLITFKLEKPAITSGPAMTTDYAEKLAKSVADELGSVLSGLPALAGSALSKSIKTE